jgi:hypothetical protein
MEMDLLKNDCDEMFLILVAGNDGIASINYATLKEILDENFDEDEWISLSRKSNQSYRVAGSNGRLKTTLAKNTFPNALGATFCWSANDSIGIASAPSTMPLMYFSPTILNG